MGIICFHDEKEKYGYMSNWYPAEFTVDGVSYNCSEQYMMHQKALFFGDKASAEKIMSTSDPALQKKYGSNVMPFDGDTWQGVRQTIVYKGVYAKFAQNEELKELLLSTGDDILAEAALKDKDWGIGLCTNDPEAFRRKLWRGKNLLGYLLMTVRYELRKENEK
ncbi:MAG: NADAR family protein [Clostridiales bacterium]|nr:NADAR family protein [Clostridiales bacterium]